MNHKQTHEAQGAGTAEEKADISKLPRLEMYAVLGLELGKKIYEKLGQIEDSIEILAHQKARELKRKKPGTEEE